MPFCLNLHSFCFLLGFGVLPLGSNGINGVVMSGLALKIPPRDRGETLVSREHKRRFFVERRLLWQHWANNTEEETTIGRCYDSESPEFLTAFFFLSVVSDLLVSRPLHEGLNLLYETP